MLIKVTDLPKLRKQFKDKKIVFCSGVFDLTHPGHVLFFEDCKKFGEVLVVCVGGDKIIKQYKGDSRPILNEHLRAKMVDSLKPVDYCFVDKGEFDKNDDLRLIREVFQTLKPNVYVFNEEAFNIKGRKLLSKKYRVEVIIPQRWFPKKFGSISTTGIIKKIAESFRQ